jgi:hypothetical protein
MRLAPALDAPAPEAEHRRDFGEADQVELLLRLFLGHLTTSFGQTGRLKHLVGAM